MHIARNWRVKKQRYSLTGEICHHCGSKVFPPRDVCPDCTKPAYDPFRLSGRGEVYSFTTVYEAPAGFQAQAPYNLALIKLEEGPMLTAQLTDVEPGHVAIGMPVEMVTRKLGQDGDEGLIQYGYKFRPRMISQAA
ncbi:MAG: Zn-ribbon domain-containing OB-fold protein [Caldilineales bacterium]|nr:Zn-ribbon domain-containing OB-fold protein [Caldilineales bacterium]